MDCAGWRCRIEACRILKDSTGWQQRDVDFSRIRHVSLGSGKYLRQTIVSAAYPSVSFNGIFQSIVLYEWQEVWRNHTTALYLALSDVRYVFQRLEVAALESNRRQLISKRMFARLRHLAQS